MIPTSSPIGNLKGLKENFRFDIISGFLVFLIALPLCLGIAKASGFPPIAGIYTAVIGGLFVSFFTNSELTIKGPAAGLIVIVLGSVDEFGKMGDPNHTNIAQGYQMTLAVIVIAGLFQIVFGLLKLGKLGDFFPASVIHGMLAAIGIIIMAKQIHVAMGVVPMGKEPFDLIEEIPTSFINMNVEIALIGLVSLVILFSWPFITHKLIRKIPAPLVVLLIAVPLGIYFDLSHEHDYDLGSLHFHINPAQLLVALPNNFFSGITFPDFSQVLTATGAKYIIMFTLVGSIESLLSARAIDTLDPYKRKSNLDKDMMAVGLGNTIVGLIGGLPMISEIVRSSSNINNGGRTKWSNFFHGMFLFLFALLAASLIQKIPNAALGAMLIFTGFRLASPKEFVKVWNIGPDQFTYFMVTLIVTLMTDLLVGVAAGILVKVLFHYINGVKFSKFFKLNISKITENNTTVFMFNSPAIFTNYLKFKPLIDNCPRDSNVTLNFTNSILVDNTYMENLHIIQDEFANQGGNLQLDGFEKHNFASKHPFATRKMIVNPSIIRPDIELTKRQSSIKLLSQKWGLDYELDISSGFLKHTFGLHAIGRGARYGKNLLIGRRNNYNILIADIVTDRFDSLSKERITITGAILNNISAKNIPDFTLEKNNLFTVIDELRGGTKEAIVNHPEFNKMFYLKNDSETNVNFNLFFTNELIEFLINNNDLLIKSINNTFVFNRYNDKLTPQEIENLIAFSDRFIQIVCKQA